MMEWSLHVETESTVIMVNLSNAKTNHCWMIFILNTYYTVWNLKDSNGIFAKSCWITNVVCKIIVLNNFCKKQKYLSHSKKCNLLISKGSCTELPGMQYNTCKCFWCLGHLLRTDMDFVLEEPFLFEMWHGETNEGREEGWWLVILID